MTTPKQIRRTGFSLVELLVVIGIVSILLALILPAVQQSRAAARRAECMSHLRQIGIALHNYHDVHDGFPPGYTPRKIGNGQAHRYRPMYSTYAWGVNLLPFVEQSALYDELDVDQTSLEELLISDPQRAAALVRTQLEIYRCPDDLAEETLESAPIATKLRFLNRDDGDVTTAIAGASASYVGNCGYYPPYHAAAATAGVLLDNRDERTGPNNGVFWPGSHVRMADITDGASHTIAIGERAWFQGSSTWVGTANVRGDAAGGAGVCLGRVYWRINELPDPPGVLITPRNELKIRGPVTARSGFSSYHAGGANFLFADGSVRFLGENIDHRVTTPPDGVDVTDPVPDAELLGTFQRLGIRDDGLPVGGF